MTTSSDAKTPLPTKQSSGPVKRIPRKRHKFITYTSATIITLLVGGCALYAFYTTVQLRQVTVQRILALRTQLDVLKHEQAESKARLDTFIHTIDATQNKLHENVSALDKNLQSSLQQRLYQGNDWSLLKARYYLELAQINAHWSNDSQTSVVLLHQADALLENIHDQRLLDIRQAIVKEVAQLQDTPALDLTGTLSQLDAAQDEVTQLPVKAIVAQPNKNTTPPKTTASTWRDHVKESLGALEKLVVIQRQDKNILPLPTPDAIALQRENIRLNLQEAQWAVLQNNETVYQLLLAQAIKNINRSFEPNASHTQALMKQLHELQQIKFVNNKPNLNQALLLLNQLIESKKPSGDSQPTTEKGNQ